MVHIVLKCITGNVSYRYNVAVVKLDKAGCYGVRTRSGERHFSILCLTTDPIHQGHKKRNPWRQHVHRATRPRSYAIDKVWEAVTSRCLGNGRSDARCKQYGGVTSIICYLCFMQHAWSCYFFFLSMHIKTGPGPIRSFVHCVLGFFSGLKQLGLGFDHSPYLAPPIGG